MITDVDNQETFGKFIRATETINNEFINYTNYFVSSLKMGSPDTNTFAEKVSTIKTVCNVYSELFIKLSDNITTSSEETDLIIKGL
jgi:hypothetical protein